MEELNNERIKQSVKHLIESTTSDSILIYKICKDNNWLNEQWFINYLDLLNKISVL